MIKSGFVKYHSERITL